MARAVPSESSADRSASPPPQARPASPPPPPPPAVRPGQQPPPGLPRLEGPASSESSELVSESHAFRLSSPPPARPGPAVSGQKIAEGIPKLSSQPPPPPPPASESSPRSRSPSGCAVAVRLPCQPQAARLPIATVPVPGPWIRLDCSCRFARASLALEPGPGSDIGVMIFRLSAQLCSSCAAETRRERCAAAVTREALDAVPCARRRAQGHDFQTLKLCCRDKKKGFRRARSRAHRLAYLANALPLHAPLH